MLIKESNIGEKDRKTSFLKHRNNITTGSEASYVSPMNSLKQNKVLCTYVVKRS